MPGLIRDRVPAPLRRRLAIIKNGLLQSDMGRGIVCALTGELGWGAEARVVALDKYRVRKIFGTKCLEINAQYNRKNEGQILEEHPDESFVGLYEWDSRGVTLERLGKPVGNAFGVHRVQDPNALANFLDGIVATLDRHDIRHHDIHPGNVLWDSRSGQYKLIDFGWVRGRAERYDLHPDLNPLYTPDDDVAVDRFRRDVVLWLEAKNRHSYLTTVKNA